MKYKNLDELITPLLPCNILEVALLHLSSNTRYCFSSATFSWRPVMESRWPLGSLSTWKTKRKSCRRCTHHVIVQGKWIKQPRTSPWEEKRARYGMRTGWPTTRWKSKPTQTGVTTFFLPDNHIKQEMRMCKLFEISKLVCCYNKSCLFSL